MVSSLEENAPQDLILNAQLRNELRNLGTRRYTTADRIDRIAKYYYHKTGKGITFSHLIMEGVSKTKRQSQNTLKRFRSKNVLFTMENRRPQVYYPTSIRSEILQHRLKNAPIDPTGIKGYSNKQILDFDKILEQTLEGYVLPLLPKSPIEIHNIHFRIKIKTDYYQELCLPSYRKNKGKHYEQIIGKYQVRFIFYSNGTIEISIASSNSPFRLENDIDLGRILAYFGEIRSRLKDLLCDPHERVVPDLMVWDITECDINKDIKVGEALHFTGLKIQVKHLHHVFRVYIKAIGRDTVCRIEKSIRPNKSAITAINDIFDTHHEAPQFSVQRE